MTVIVKTSIDPADFDFGEVFAGTAATRFEIEQSIPIHDRDFIPFIRAHTNDSAELESQLASADGVRDVTIVDTAADSVLLRIDWELTTDGFFRSMRAHDVVVLGGRGTPDRWEFHLRFPDHETLSAFAESCWEAGVTLDVSQIYTPTADSTGETEARPPSDIAASLTDAQRETLQLAFEEGYFETPRWTTLADLAETVGISDVAINHRLRRGLTTVLEQLFIEGKSAAGDGDGGDDDDTEHEDADG